MNKEKKKRKRRLIPIIAIFMACITVLGALAAFLPKSRDSSLNQESINTEIPDETFKDVLTEAEKLAAVVTKTACVPKNAKLLTFISFSEVVSSEKEEIEQIPGYSGSRTLLNYGNVSTLNDYLEFTTASNESNAGLSSYLAFKVKENSATGYDTRYADYITVDFDIWTNTDFLNSMQFYFVDANGDIDAQPRFEFIRRYVYSGFPCFLSTDGSEQHDLYNNEIYAPMHLTFVFKLTHSNDLKVVSDTRIYLDGKLINDSANNFELAPNIDYFEIYFNKSDYVQQGRSFCIDNFQVMAFGNGSGNYTGALSELYTSNKLTLDKCADSVLYKK